MPTRNKMSSLPMNDYDEFLIELIYSNKIIYNSADLNVWSFSFFSFSIGINVVSDVLDMFP